MSSLRGMDTACSAQVMFARYDYRKIFLFICAKLMGNGNNNEQQILFKSFFPQTSTVQIQNPTSTKAHKHTHCKVSSSDIVVLVVWS